MGLKKTKEIKIMKIITKKEIRKYCDNKNIHQPRFSGKNKIIYITPIKITYTIEQELIEMATRIGYKIMFGYIPYRFYIR